MSLDLRAAVARYGREEALAGVDLTIVSGETTALVGPSGSGKSTVLRLLAGLKPPTSGEVWIGGERASAPGRILIPPHRRGVGMVFQDLALWPNLSAVENVALGLYGRRSERHVRAGAALALCGIEALAERRPGSLSGGQQQRVALARALASEPAFLLLDEPFAGLDFVTKTRLFEEIARLARESSVTPVLVTHDPFEALALCRSVAVLEAGKLVERGELSALLRAPRSEILSVFRSQLGAARSLDGTPPADPLHPL